MISTIQTQTVKLMLKELGWNGIRTDHKKLRKEEKKNDVLWFYLD